MLNKNKLSKYATSDKDAFRLRKEELYEQPFFEDIDRILYSLSYMRYLDKTQVFTYQKNNHITKRMIHVQYVSKIARTIGRKLNLNQDLIEAIALGHDLGHTPFGHVGEAFLNEISLKYTNTFFKHNIHSVRLLKHIEKHGQGLNITYQVLDGIMCHNGEILSNVYYPAKKDAEMFLKEYEESYTKNIKLTPSTLEGCVVRISDLAGYLGKDIEDGLRLGIIKKEQIPQNIINVLGLTNKEIVDTIIKDIIKNSFGKNYIKLSENIFNAMKDLKKFNYDNIYINAYTDEERIEINNMLNELFKHYLNVLNNNQTNSLIVTSYLNNLTDEYKKNSNERIVIDYIAGMTDEYFLSEYNKIRK